MPIEGSLHLSLTYKHKGLSFVLAQTELKHLFTHLYIKNTCKFLCSTCDMINDQVEAPA